MIGEPDIARIKAAYARIKEALTAMRVAGARRRSSSETYDGCDFGDIVNRAHHMRWASKYNADVEIAEAEYQDALAELFMAMEGITIPGGPSECK